MIAGQRTARVLVLGGTREGRDLAAALDARGDVQSVSSLAGRTAVPLLPPGDVRVGGFGGPDGLADYLEREAIAVVFDATHPFAARMSANAVAACARARVPLMRLERPAWEAGDGDRFHHAADLAAAVALARNLGTRIFLTLGRTAVAAFAGVEDRFFLIRAIEAPSAPLPPRNALLLARGPFEVAGEREILDAYAIDTIVAKNSGGTLTVAKLAAARERGIPVVLVARPAIPAAPTVASIDAALAWLARLAP